MSPRGTSFAKESGTDTTFTFGKECHMSPQNDTTTNTNGTTPELPALGTNLIGKKIVKLAWQATSMHLKQVGDHPVDTAEPEVATEAAA